MSLSLNRPADHQWVENKPPRDFVTKDIYVGGGDHDLALHVVTAEYKGSGEPTAAQLKNLHKLRTDDRMAPVVLVVEVDPQHCVVFGYNADWAPTRKIEYSTIARILQAALDEPNPIAARERINTLREALDTTALPGIKNSGLFANHELATGVPTRPDFNIACKRSVPLLSLTGTPLLNGLGFTHSSAGNNAYLLRGTGKDGLAVAVMLQDDEMFDAPSVRLNGLPVAKGLAVAEEHNVSWIILLRRTKIRLYPAQLGLGVGRKGLTETYVEIDLPQLTNANAGYLSLIFSAEALSDGGTAYEIMESSRQYAVGLGERLREKVYDEIIPLLSVAVAKSVRGRKHSFTPEMLTRAYDLTLRIFFRILFQVYAEDRKLLPLGENPSFDKLALKTLARKLAADRDLYKSADSSELWEQLSKVWTAIDEGSTALGIPAYNGGLFSSDEELHPESAAIAELTITDDIMGPALRALLLDIGDVGDPVPIDFRSLGVREFGTIYEGLLESSLGVAETDLTLDKDKNWVPAKKKSDEILAPEGSVYFHNTSGQRKGTGSYFTPSFVVEHLLERSLDPALDTHLAKVAELVASGDDAAATEKFFDFRVADIAMGSGHFLTAAIDHIEKKMAAFLTSPEHPMPGVLKEILELEAAARAAVGADGPEIDRSSLLRRQIARRCIYGLDLNPIAVELSRVSIWIHTFVRGLPMSSLDHNLVCGNSLTGIGTIDEALTVLVPGRKAGVRTFYDERIEAALEASRKSLAEVASLSERDRSESRRAGQIIARARREAADALSLFDVATLHRIGFTNVVSLNEVDEMIRGASLSDARKILDPLQSAHFPAAFADVFSREVPGFDVIVGNPPWDELHLNADKFWVRYFPGHMGLSDAEKEKKRKLYARQRPDLQVQLEAEQEEMNRARTAIRAVFRVTDLYQAFIWRYLDLLGDHGHIGVVLPRGATVGASLDSWREQALSDGAITEVFHCINKGGWMFEDVHPQTQIILLTYSKAARGFVTTTGIARSQSELREIRQQPGLHLTISELERVSPAVITPSVPHPSLFGAFQRMREHPSIRELTGAHAMEIGFDGIARIAREAKRVKESATGRLGLIQGRHIHHWKVPTPDEWIQTSGSVKLANQPGLVFRKLTRSDDSRTFICSVAPRGTFVKETGYWLVPTSSDPHYLKFLLGVLGSRVLDWYSRTVVDRHILPSLACSLPVPVFSEDDLVHMAIVDHVSTIFQDSQLSGLGFIGGSSTIEEFEAVLDGLVGNAYGLSTEMLGGVLGSFHPTWDHRAHMRTAVATLIAAGGQGPE